MVVKATVSPEEKALIEEQAAKLGMSVSSFIKKQTLGWTDPDPTPLMQFIEAQAPVLRRMDELAINSLQNKVIYEREILELLDRVKWIEDITAAAVKEVLKRGNSG